MSLKIGITGQAGFIGTHLFNTFHQEPEKFELIRFEKVFFDSDQALDDFVSKCDVIVHLASMNRHKDPQVVYHTNINLTNQLINSLKRTRSKAHVLFHLLRRRNVTTYMAGQKK